MLQTADITNVTPDGIASIIHPVEETEQQEATAPLGNLSRPVALLTDDPIHEEIMKHLLSRVGGEATVYRQLIAGLHNVIRDPSRFSFVLIKFQDEQVYDENYLHAIKLLRSRSLRIFRENDDCLPIALVSPKVEEQKRQQPSTVYSDAAFGEISTHLQLVKMLVVSRFSNRQWLLDFRMRYPNF